MLCVSRTFVWLWHIHLQGLGFGKGPQGGGFGDSTLLIRSSWSLPPPVFGSLFLGAHELPVTLMRRAASLQGGPERTGLPNASETLILLLLGGPLEEGARGL